MKNSGFKLEEVHDVVKCEIVNRINRFLVEVVIDDSSTIAYMNNTGRLSQFLITGKKAYCLKTYGGKTRHRLFAVDVKDEKAAIIDTRIQMHLLEKAVDKGLIYWLGKSRIVKRNCRLGRSLVDYFIEHDGRFTYLEVKSAVLWSEEGYAMYPDCPTLRGRRQIMDIIRCVEMGGSGIIVFIAALPYVKAFKPNPRGDVKLSRLLLKAYEMGCILKATSMHFDACSSSFYLDKPDIPIILQ